MIHQPKEILQISVHNPLAPFSDLAPNLTQSILPRSPSPISEAGVIEYGFKDRFKPIQ